MLHLERRVIASSDCACSLLAPHTLGTLAKRMQLAQEGEGWAFPPDTLERGCAAAAGAPAFLSAQDGNAPAGNSATNRNAPAADLIREGQILFGSKFLPRPLPRTERSSW